MLQSSDRIAKARYKSALDLQDNYSPSRHSLHRIHIERMVCMNHKYIVLHRRYLRPDKCWLFLYIPHRKYQCPMHFRMGR